MLKLHVPRAEASRYTRLRLPETLRLKPSKTVQRVTEKRKALAPSDHAARYRRMLSGPRSNATWDKSYMPYLSDILDAAVFPTVRDIVVKKVQQTGVSTLIDTFIAFLADEAPGPAFVVYPDQQTSGKNSRDRLQETFKASPYLRQFLPSAEDDMAALRIKLKSMLIYFGWAGSTTSLGNFTAKYVFLDEVDKYPEKADKAESGPMNLARDRATVYPHDCKIFTVSTPTIEGSNIDTAFNNAMVRFDRQVVCTSCGHRQVMEFVHIRWPKDENGKADYKDVENKKQARYICPSCEASWDDHRRDQAVRAGQWIARDDGRELFSYLRDERPGSIAFHIPAWISPVVSLSRCAAKFIHAHTAKDSDLFQSFDNSIRAAAYVPFRSQRAADRILALRDDRPRGLVPAAADVLGIFIDTQKRGFWYEVRAFAFGHHLETWQILEGFVESFAAIDDILDNVEFLDAGGTRYAIRGGMIDSGGGKSEDEDRSRTYQVYEWCARRRTIFPTKGVNVQKTPIRVTALEAYPGTNKAIPGGLKLYTLDSNLFKNQLADKLAINPTDPGAWHLHSETSLEYAEQMCVETCENVEWSNQRKKDNHYWDIGYLALAWAYVMELRLRCKDGRVTERGGRPSAGHAGRRVISSGLHDPAP